MTTLAEFTLSLARKASAPVRESVATGGDMNTLIDINQDFTPGQYAKGTLWFLSGSQAGRVKIIRTNGSNRFDFDAFSSAICTQQVESLTVLGAITGGGAGNATFAITAAGMNNSPKTISVAVANSDTASQVAGKIRAALKLDSDITDFFTVSGTGANIILTCRRAVANDTTLVFTVDNGTCAGLTLATSTNTTAGVVGPRYAIAEGYIPYDIYVQAVNEALRSLAPYYTEDVSLQTVALQEEYTKPNGVNNIKQVHIATASEAPWREYRHLHWDETPTKLVFPCGYAPVTADRRIRLVYEGAHTDLSSDTANIPYGINETVLKWKALIHIAEVGLRIHQKDEAHRWPDYATEAQEFLRRTRTNQKKLQRDPRLAD